MIDRLLRLPAAPRYDQDKDGNPFDWIVATAPKVRAQRSELQHEHRQKVRELDDE